MKRLSLVFLVLLATVPMYAGGRRRGVPAQPFFPKCTVVTGTPGVTFTSNEGLTLAPVAEPLLGTGYTWGVATLDTPHTLLSWHKLTMSISRDDGCSWTPVASLDNVEFPPRIAPAPGGIAYVWSDNRQYMARYDSRGLQSLKVPGSILGVGIDRTNADHFRIGLSDGTVWDSTNGGAAFDYVGTLKFESLMMYRFAFDPNDLDHVVAGTSTGGAYVSRDGGRTWAQSNIAARHNAFNLVVSPVDGNVVWAMALDLDATQTAPAYGRRIYRSTDGGATYQAVVEQTDDVVLINGPLLVAHPLNANVLYFVFGTYYRNYGTDIFKYDASTRLLTVAHNPYHGVDEIAFSRTDPRVMYLGLEHVVLH